jgi:DNA-nicking Smr family endonuclease
VPSIKRSHRNPEYVPEEIDLHGLTVDEALPRLDTFIHAAFQAGYYQVRIVHGKGSGILRREVGLYLTNHPLVYSHRLADKYHGGDGATQVVLTDH